MSSHKHDRKRDASQPAMPPVETSSLPIQRHLSLSSEQWSIQSLMTHFVHEVRRCERLIEAENDRLRRQLSCVSDIAERHQVYKSDSNHQHHALVLIRTALASDEDSGRDLGLFGQRYSARNKLQRDLETAVQVMTGEFAVIMTAMETRAASQLQELIDVSTAIECELEDSIEHLQRQLSSERTQGSKLKTENQALSSSYEAYQLAAQREIDRLAQLLHCEQATKHECELDFDTFRHKYEAQQWSAYQGSAQLGCVQAELQETRGKIVFLEIENDQLQQHIRALNATIEYLSSPGNSANQSKSQAAVDFRQRDRDHWTSAAISRAKILPASGYIECEVDDEDRPEFVVCVDDVCFRPVCSYLAGEIPVECEFWASSPTVRLDQFVAVCGDRPSEVTTSYGAFLELCPPSRTSS